MMLNDFHAFSEATAMNVFLFNYRGVSHSAGTLQYPFTLVCVCVCVLVEDV